MLEIAEGLAFSLLTTINLQTLLLTHHRNVYELCRQNYDLIAQLRMFQYNAFSPKYPSYIQALKTVSNIRRVSFKLYGVFLCSQFQCKTINAWNREQGLDSSCTLKFVFINTTGFSSAFTKQSIIRESVSIPLAKFAESGLVRMCSDLRDILLLHEED